MNLPIPKSRSGVFASLILVACFFLFYYRVFYELARNAYLDEYLDPVSVKTDTLPADVKIVLRIPKYMSPVIPGWVYGSIENVSDDKKTINLSFTLQNENIILIPSSYQNELIFQRALSNIEILPHSTVYFRLPWSSNISDNNTILLYVNNKEANLVNSVQSIQASTSGALRRSVMENLFLPPWANGLLPVLALVFCYFAENDIKNNEKNSLKITIFLPILILGLLEGIFSYWLVLGYLGLGFLWYLIGGLGWIGIFVYHSYQNQVDVARQNS